MTISTGEGGFIATACVAALTVWCILSLAIIGQR